MNEADGSERGWSRQRQNAVHLEMIAISRNIAFDIIIIFIPHNTHGRHNYEYIFTPDYNNRAIVNAQKYKSSKLHVRLAFICLLLVCLVCLFVWLVGWLVVVVFWLLLLVLLLLLFRLYFWLLVLFSCYLRLFINVFLPTHIIRSIIFSVTIFHSMCRGVGWG